MISVCDICMLMNNIWIDDYICMNEEMDEDVDRDKEIYI